MFYDIFFLFVNKQSPISLIRSGTWMYQDNGAFSNMDVAACGFLWGFGGVFLHKNTPPSAGSGAAAKITELTAKAQELYPKLAGILHDHHIHPQYMGGSANGVTVTIDGAYHQLITNAFRKLWAIWTGTSWNRKGNTIYESSV